MPEVPVVELAAVGIVGVGPVTIGHRPAREAAGNFQYITVHVADGASLAVQGYVPLRHDAQIVLRAQSVQLKQFPGVVLVGALVTALHVVQVIEHGGALGVRLQHLAEVAQDVGADYVAIIVHPDAGVGGFVAIDIEMVVPEIHQDFLQLAPAVDGPGHGGVEHLVHWPHPLFPGDVLRPVVLRPQLGQGLAQGAEGRVAQPGFQIAVVDGLGIQLLVHPGSQAGHVRAAAGVEILDVAGSWPEGGAGKGHGCKGGQGG